MYLFQLHTHTQAHTHTHAKKRKENAKSHMRHRKYCSLKNPRPVLHVVGQRRDFLSRLWPADQCCSQHFLGADG